MTQNMRTESTKDQHLFDKTASVLIFFEVGCYRRQVAFHNTERGKSFAQCPRTKGPFLLCSFGRREFFQVAYQPFANISSFQPIPHAALAVSISLQKE